MPIATPARKPQTRSTSLTVAALKIYRDRCYAGASNLAIARAADVAPATVRNHFPEPEGLARAVFDAIPQRAEHADPGHLDGLTGLHNRVERLARELATFYERGAPWCRLARSGANSSARSSSSATTASPPERHRSRPLHDRLR
jgi:AcrR family transcriptional regulator